MTTWRTIFPLFLLAHALTARAAEITVCSFNVQFLGNSQLREDSALAMAISGFEVVVVQELVAPPSIGT